MITNDTEHVSGTYSAYELILRRLALKRWDLNERTRFRKVISLGDRLAFYAAGKRKNRGCIIACAEVGIIQHRSEFKQNDELLTPALKPQLELRSIEIIEPIILRCFNYRATGCRMKK